MGEAEPPDAMQAEIAALRGRIEALETRVRTWEAFGMEVVRLAGRAAEQSADARLARGFRRMLGKTARALHG
jgi:hypothetical protein